MERKKILRIIARLNIGGPAIHSIHLTEGLNNKKYESALVTGMVGSNEGDMSYLAHEKGIKPIVIKELGREISWRDDFIALWKIFKLLKKENPDIVHTHTAKAGTLGRTSVIIYNGLLFFKNNIGKVQNLFLRNSKQNDIKRIKLIHTFHGHVFHSYFSWVKTKVFIFIERVLALFTDKIITISPEQAVDICKTYRITSENKISVISLGLDLNKYLNGNNKGSQFREKWRISNKAIIIGIVGRLVPIKNHKMFFDSTKIIKSQLPTLDLKFAVIGDGELMGNLIDYANQPEIKEDIIFTGWQKNLEEIYAALDLVVLTSFNEGTPVSLIEAMAAGKAVIATRVGGVVNLMGKFLRRLESVHNIDIFDNGILVESDDATGLAEAMNLLANDESLRNKMGEKGRAYVKERFGVDRLVKDMERLYDSL